MLDDEEHIQRRADNDDPKRLRVRKLNQRKRKWLLIVSSIVIGIAIGILFFIHRNSGPLPKSIVKEASFPLFYPTKLPYGFSMVENSAKITQDVVFYAIASGNQRISISEEATPSDPPNLSQLTGFTTFQALAGSAATGTSDGGPTGIIVGNTTLIIADGSKNTPSVAVTDVIRAMNTLQ